MKALRQLTSPIVLLSWLSMTACATDMSSDARLSAVMNKCFRTTEDAVLYLNRFSPPVTLSEFNSNFHGAATSVARQITPPPKRGLLIAAPKVNSLGAVTRGTPFTIEAMRRFSHPEQGSIWITAARIRDGQFAGQMITLPWDDLYLEFHGDGGWITDFVQREPFVRDP